MAFHGEETGLNVHHPYSFEYADATARGAATGFLPAHVGMFARQLDDNSIWMLTDDSPVTWVPVGSPGGSYTDEEARDALGTALVAGNNIDITVNDGSDTITIDVEALTSADIGDFNEAAQDAVGGIATDSSSIDFTYNDGANTLTAAIIDEYVYDLVQSMFSDGTGIDFTINDGTNSITAEPKFAGTGSAGTVSHSDHGHTTIGGFSINLGDGTNVITSTEAFVLVRMPVAFTLTEWRIQADASGSIVCEVERAAQATPSTFSSVAGTAKPTLSSAQSANDGGSLTGWGDATWDAGDIIKVYVSGSPSTVKRVGVHFAGTRAV